MPVMGCSQSGRLELVSIRNGIMKVSYFLYLLIINQRWTAANTWHCAEVDQAWFKKKKGRQFHKKRAAGMTGGS
jgi:hypothetical protein